MKFIYKIQRFMIGRYGPDEFYMFLLKFYVGLLIVDIFINSRVLNGLELFIVVLLLYRFFSKNISRRRKENQKYLEIRQMILKPFCNIKRNYRERENYVYKRCSKCKTTLRLPLPRKKGIQHAKCPKCEKKITFLCLREEKIEVIRNKGYKNKKYRKENA